MKACGHMKYFTRNRYFEHPYLRLTLTDLESDNDNYGFPELLRLSHLRSCTLYAQLVDHSLTGKNRSTAGTDHIVFQQCCALGVPIIDEV